MDPDSPMPLFVVGALAGGLIVFFVAATGALRLGCSVASRVGVYAGKSEPFTPPCVRHAVCTVFAAVLLMGLAGSVVEPVIACLAANLDVRLVRMIANTLEWSVYAAIVADDLSATQQVHRRVALLAATLHTAFLLGAALVLNVSIRAIMR